MDGVMDNLIDRVNVTDNYSSYVKWAKVNNRTILGRDEWASVLEWWCVA